jgi:2-haloacid dehalogenase
VKQRLDFDSFEALTFDCYGTLIDWERGLLAALRPVLKAHGAEAGDDQLLEAFARREAALEAGDYHRYRDILAEALRGLAADFGFVPTDEEASAFGDSVKDWPAFDDSSASLKRLTGTFKLGVITNCDDDLFAHSARRLGIDFDWVVTAEQARSYKPSLHNFEVAFERIGLPKERILHVAQSLHHDHVPAKRLGMTTVWIDRRHDREGFGATPEAEAAPDLAVPDMQSFADLATGAAAGSR